MNSNELGIFFRNNHFNVLHKRASNNALYLLVTDQGKHAHSDGGVAVDDDAV